jgi:hypothetical protein
MTALALVLALQSTAPINAACPVKPNQKARPSSVVVYKGRVIGLC